MLERANAGTVLSSDLDVDSEFLTLMLQDEEWLEAEFAAVVSEPSESPRPQRRTVRVITDRSFPAGVFPSRCHGSCGPHAGSTGRCGGHGWQRTRSPPRRPRT